MVTRLLEGCGQGGKPLAKLAKKFVATIGLARVWPPTLWALPRLTQDTVFAGPSRQARMAGGDPVSTLPQD